MSKICFLCPGQGSEAIGMGRSLWEQSQAAREVFRQGNAFTGVDLVDLCVRAEGDVLNRTENAQLALFTVAAAAAAFLAEKGITPHGTAGFSFGECSAFYVAGMLSLEEGFWLVQTRARCMAEITAGGDGAMCAVLGLDADTIRTLARHSGGEAVNFNCPGQTVISGPRKAVETLAALCRDRGAKRTVMLGAAGAFHTAAMSPAAKQLTAAIRHKGLTAKPPAIPLYTNVDGRPLSAAADLGTHLATQMISPVLWQQSMEHCLSDGFTLFYELGPGRTLGGFLKKISPAAECISLQSLF